MPTEFASLDVETYLQHAPLAWSVGLGAVALIGLVLWLAGGKLAKTGVVLAGFVLGGLVMASVAIAWTAEGAALGVGTEAAEVAEQEAGTNEDSGSVSDESPTAADDAAATSGGGVWVLALGIGGAIAGALLAVLLYRLWIALMTAVVLALVVPGATLIWTGTPPEVDPESIEGAQEEVQALAVEAGQEALRGPGVVQNLTGDLANDLAGNLTESLSSTELRDAARAQARKLIDVLRGVWAEQREALGRWWDGLPAAQRSVVLGGSALGAVVGLVLGLVLPRVAASLQTALVGSLLMFFPLKLLLVRHVGGEAWLPGTPRAVLLTLGLITVIGLLVQCTVFRKKTDK